MSDADDPIAQVCGVPAAEMLTRAGRATPPSLLPALTMPPPPAAAPPTAGPAEAAPPTLVPPRPAVWSLLDLGDGTREAFVQAAHQAMLGRPAGEAEMALRLAQLNRGRTRLGILLRLAMSEEGRAVAAPPIRGPGLRAIHKLAPAIVAVARLPVLRAAQRTLRIRRR